MAQKLSLTERIRAAGLNLSVARASFEIWWVYKSVDTRPLYIEGMNNYSEFFRFDEEAHFRAMIVGLHTVFDARRKTISLESIVKEALEGDKLSTTMCRLRKLDDKIRKVKLLRH